MRPPLRNDPTLPRNHRPRNQNVEEVNYQLIPFALRWSMTTFKILVKTICTVGSQKGRQLNLTSYLPNENGGIVGDILLPERKDKQLSIFKV